MCSFGCLKSWVFVTSEVSGYRGALVYLQFQVQQPGFGRGWGYSPPFLLNGKYRQELRVLGRQECLSWVRTECSRWSELPEAPGLCQASGKLVSCSCRCCLIKVIYVIA